VFVERENKQHGRERFTKHGITFITILYFQRYFLIVATICRLHGLGVLDGAPYYSFAPCYQYEFVVESSIKLCTKRYLNDINAAFPTTLSQGVKSSIKLCLILRGVTMFRTFSSHTTISIRLK